MVHARTEDLHKIPSTNLCYSTNLQIEFVVHSRTVEDAGPYNCTNSLPRKSQFLYADIPLNKNSSSFPLHATPFSSGIEMIPHRAKDSLKIRTRKEISPRTKPDSFSWYAACGNVIFFPPQKILFCKQSSYILFASQNSRSEYPCEAISLAGGE